MDTAVPQETPAVIAHVEMFSDSVVWTAGDERRVVQLMQRWWVYDDGSYTMTMHPVNNPMRGHCVSERDDPDGFNLVHRRTIAMWELATEE